MAVIKKTFKKIPKLQYVAEAIARSQGMFPTQWKKFLKHAKAAIYSGQYYDDSYGKNRLT